jgi:dihydrolipoamide dehydrogenase
MVVGEVAVEVDAVVLGGGPGGYSAAIRLGQLGKSVVLVEKGEMGGACLHRGCIPSKALIHAGETLDKIQQADHMGIEGAGEKPELNMKTWQNWKGKIITKLEKGVEGLCSRNQVTVVRGEGAFLSEDRISVDTGGDVEFYKFTYAVIATGSAPVHPGFIDMQHPDIHDSTSFLQLEEVPKRLTVLGGGYIGVELGSAMAKAGAETTIIEMSERLLPAAPEKSALEVEKKARKQMNVLTSTSLKQVREEKEALSLEVDDGKGTTNIYTDCLLVTVGRKPNTSGIGLEQAGIEMETGGFVPVDMECRTNIKHIFAIGDVTPGPALAHKASKQGKVAAEVISEKKSAVDSAFIPYVIFSDPPLAGVGLTKEEAEANGYEVKTGKFSMAHNGLAMAEGKAEGFAEVIVDADSHLLLGFHAAGPDAANLISEGTLALELASRVEDLALTIHPHPTLSEGWLEAAEHALGQSIHVPS